MQVDHAGDQRLATPVDALRTVVRCGVDGDDDVVFDQQRGVFEHGVAEHHAGAGKIALVHASFCFAEDVCLPPTSIPAMVSMARITAARCSPPCPRLAAS